LGEIGSDFVQKVPPVFTFWILAEILDKAGSHGGFATFFSNCQRTGKISAQTIFLKENFL